MLLSLCYRPLRTGFIRTSTVEYNLQYHTSAVFSYNRRSLSEGHPDDPSILRSWIPVWTSKLKNACVEDAENDVETIVLHALKQSGYGQHESNQYRDVHTFNVSMFYHQQIPTEILSKINELCNNRAERMPLQYVIGEWDFRDLTLMMSPPVFIPRPETELLVDLIINSNGKLQISEDVNFIEVGCGTGAISLSLLRELPQAVAIDSSACAIRLTNKNSARYNCQDRLRTYQHYLDYSYPKLFSSLPKFDFIVSNPPYIFSEDMDKLEPEISSYEDYSALHGGYDGMELIKRIIYLAKYVLNPSALIWLETDSKHPELIKNWLDDHPELDVKFLNSFTDFNHRPRFVQLIFKPDSS